MPFARTLRDGDFGVARNAEIGAVLDRLAVDQHLRDLVHRDTRELRIPERNAVDRAALEELAGFRRQARAVDADLALHAGFFDRTADADHVERGRALEALQVRMLAQHFLRDFIGALAVVIGFEFRFDQIHLRIFGLGVADPAVGPLHLRAAAERTDQRHPLAVVVHARGEALVQAGAVGGVVEGFDVDHRVLRVVGLMGHHLDAAIHRLLQRRFERRRIVGHHGNRRDLLRDQVFDDLQLLRRIRAARTGLIRVHARVVLRELLDAVVHPVEPVDTGHLDDRDDRLVGCSLRSGDHAYRKSACCERGTQSSQFHAMSPLSFDVALLHHHGQSGLVVRRVLKPGFETWVAPFKAVRRANVSALRQNLLH